MKIYISNKQKDIAVSKAKVKALVREVVAYEGQCCDEVSIHFVDKKNISKLHQLYFQDPTPTDCISFPMDAAEQEDYRILGDVFVCPLIALEYAVKHKTDPYKETTLYVIHGLLHLMGYDDIEVEERKSMRKAEKRHLKHLELSNLMLCQQS